MKQMKSRIIVSFAALVLLTCCQRQTQGELNLDYKTEINGTGEIGIIKKPIPADYRFIFGSKTVFPSYDDQSKDGFTIDLRSANLSKFDLSGKSLELLRSTFDSKTVWPESLPAVFLPDTIMDLGKDPGLNIRTLHALGITGKNVSLAIIDQTLLVDHIEYKDQLRLYEEIHNPGDEASMHGSAVASIAVGKTVGVAPNADLYYIAETHGVLTNGKFAWDLSYLAQSIDRICEINKSLPQEKKIRVVSISLGINGNFHNSKMALASIKKAAEQNIYVVFCDSDNFMGMFRNPLLDPNDFSSYEPGLVWSQFYYKKDSQKKYKDTVMIPMDSRCVASPTGTSDYVFYYEGGLSWSVPYVAGVYALACQVYPKITPTVFWEIVRRTGETIILTKDGNGSKFGCIINPVKIIEEIGKLT